MGAAFGGVGVGLREIMGVGAQGENCGAGMEWGWYGRYAWGMDHMGLARGCTAQQ